MKSIRLFNLILALFCLLNLPSCTLFLIAAGMMSSDYNLNHQQSMMDKQLGTSAYDRASAPDYMGYR